MGDVGHGQRAGFVPLGHSSLYFFIGLVKAPGRSRDECVQQKRASGRIGIGLFYQMLVSVWFGWMFGVMDGLVTR